jgi:transposase
MKGPKKDGRLGNLEKLIQNCFKEKEMENQVALGKENNAEVLYLAFELSHKKWKLGFSDGKAAQVRQVTISSGELEACRQEIQKAKKRFGMEESAAVRSCYEAGREGFWLQRALEAKGIENIVVDASSIEVNRRQRRAKTDRMDVEKLVRQLVRYWRGEHNVWSVVRVPSGEAEDSRQAHRGLEVLKEERKQHRVRIQSLLFTQGIDVKVGSKFLPKLEQWRCWNQEPIPAQMKQRIQDEYHRLQLVEVQIRERKAKQAEQVRADQKNAALEKVRRLQQLMGIGLGSSWIFVMELFGWRQFRNQRELAAAVGLTPTPYNSGDSAREQGISRSGNRRIRRLLIEIAWAWLRFQRQSKLSQWYEQRFAKAGQRMRRIGIVAMARRLVIDLWRYLEAGIVPEGAQLKALANSCPR